jgi:8-oxo-dGTP pyrophosphatase MutT (NUDIX family)
MKRVVAGICIKYKDNIPHILLGLKPSGHWEFPGGKVKKDETDTNALHREWIEELDADIEVGDFYVNVENGMYNVHFYKVELSKDENDGSEAIAKEHIEVHWHGLDSLEDVSMVVGNDLVVDLLIEDYL